MSLQNSIRNGSIVQDQGGRGFTIPEVIIAGSIMIILCVGTMTAYVQAIKLNRGNNLRMQALAVLQREVEYYRSLKFVPAVFSPDLAGRDTTAMGFRESNPENPSNSIRFDIFVRIDNDLATPGVQIGGNDTTTFKEIYIEARPQVEQNEVWLRNLGTDVTIQRVRSN